MPTLRRGALADFSTDPERLMFLCAFALAIGIAAAAVAKALLALIGFVTHIAYYGQSGSSLISPDPHRWGLWSICIPIAGGLAVGAIARFGSEKIRGHGIPEAIAAILDRDSIIEARVAFYKPIASALAIGTGGPFGAEGPIIMTGGALGSLFAQFLRLSSLERRTLLVCGAAGGMSATFGAPIASVLIAVELLLFEWRPRSFVPVVVAAFAAERMRSLFIASAPPFVMHGVHSASTGAFGWAIVVGIGAGAVSAVMTKLLYVCEDAYDRLPVHWMWWPAIGGAIVGIGGWFVPQTLGVGYATISGLLQGAIPIGVVAAILAVKIVIWIASLGSGTSGGVLAPLLMIGGAMGTLFAIAIPGHDAPVWAAVGMAAIMGGTMRAPFMATLFALETTHAWGLLPVVFLGCVAATAFTVVFVPRSILTEKLARRGMHVAREYAVHPLELIAVGDVLVRPEEVVTLDAGCSIEEVARRIRALDPQMRHREYPVLDERGTPLGFASHGAIVDRALIHDGSAVSSLCRRPVRVHRDDRVRSAANAMAQGDARSALVFGDDGRWLGIVTADDLLRAWKRGLSAETRRVRVRSFRRIFSGRRRAGVVE